MENKFEQNNMEKTAGSSSEGMGCFSEEFVDDLNKKKVDYFENSLGTPIQKLESPMRFLSRQWLAKTSIYMDIFKQTKNVAGSIVECGVYFGNCLMTMAKMSAAFEPYNYKCKIIGFDTFEGNKGVNNEKDFSKEQNLGCHQKEGGYYAPCYDDLKKAIEIFDLDRPLNTYPKIELIKGDIRQTAEKYVKEHPNLLVRILSLTVNLYEPTKIALRTFLPRMSKGSIIIVSSLNLDMYGTTQAILEEIGVRNYKIITPPEYSAVSYIILE